MVDLAHQDLGLLLDDLHGGGHFLVSVQQVLLARRLQIVDRVEVYPAPLADGRVEIARHRQVEHEQRPLRLDGLHLSELFDGKERFLRARRADHEVGFGQCFKQTFPRHRPSAPALGQLGRSLVAAGICFACCIPYLVYRHHSAETDLEPLFRPVPCPQLPGVPWPSDVMNNATLLGWFLPGKSPWVLGEAFQYPVLHVHYLGWTCLALSVAGLLWKPWGKCPRRFATSLAVVCTAVPAFLVAHGYCLVVDPTPSLRATADVPLPLYWIVRSFPQLAAFAVPYRAVVVVSLCLAVLTAIGLKRFGAHLTQRGRFVLCSLSGIAILVETLVLSPVPFPMPVRSAAVPQVYRDIAATDGCAAVLDVPNEAHGLGAGANLPFIYHQSSHGHPTNLHLHYGPLHEPRMTPFQLGLAHACGTRPARNPRPNEDTVLLDFRFLVLHEDRLTDNALETVHTYLGDHLSLVRIYPEDGIRLYTSIAVDDESRESPYHMNSALPDVCASGSTRSRLGFDRH